MKVDIDGSAEDYLIMFKNKTHITQRNRTLGGAATCLGGAIRDPLSGKFVYQAMRVTEPLIPEPLLKIQYRGASQRKITEKQPMDIVLMVINWFGNRSVAEFMMKICCKKMELSCNSSLQRKCIRERR